MLYLPIFIHAIDGIISCVMSDTWHQMDGTILLIQDHIPTQCYATAQDHSKCSYE